MRIKTFARRGIRKDEIKVLTDVEIFVTNDFEPQFAYGDRGPPIDIHRVEVHRAPEFEPN